MFCNTNAFLTAASCPKKDFYTPPHTLKTCNILLYCILKIARHLYCILKKALKSRPKKLKKSRKKVGKRRQKDNKKAAKRHQKRRHKKQQERQQKCLFLNLSCCCLETGLKPVLFYLVNIILEIVGYILMIFL